MKVTRRDIFRTVGAAITAAPALTILSQDVPEALPLETIAAPEVVECTTTLAMLPANINSIMAGWVDRQPWKYFDTVRFIPQSYADGFTPEDVL